jgi:hypothetical protein
MLDEIIVLGLIPGTHLQITFELWLTILVSLPLGASVWRSYKKQILQKWVVVGAVIIMMRQAPRLQPQ